MSDDQKIPTPVFIFRRRRDVELELGIMLAGDLIIDIPYTRKNLNRRQWRLVIEIFKQLAETACSVQLPDNAILYGWPDGRRPDNADAFVNNNPFDVVHDRDRSGSRLAPTLSRSGALGKRPLFTEPVNSEHNGGAAGRHSGFRRDDPKIRPFCHRMRRTRCCDGGAHLVP